MLFSGFLSHMGSRSPLAHCRCLLSSHCLLTSPTSRLYLWVHRSMILELHLPAWYFSVASTADADWGRCFKLFGERHCTDTRGCAVALTLLMLKVSFGNWFAHRLHVMSTSLPANAMAVPLIRNSKLSISSERVQAALSAPGAQQIHPPKSDSRYLLTVVIAVFIAFVTNCFASKIFFKSLIF